MCSEYEVYCGPNMEQKARRKGLQQRACRNLRVVLSQNFPHWHVFFEEKGYQSSSLKQKKTEKR